jgi:outer membrane lipoprotein-sorting protein
MKNRVFLGVSFVLILSIFIWGETGSTILKRVDERMIGAEAPKDVQTVMVMTIVSAKGREKKRELKAWSKNNLDKDDWRVMKFLSPPDVRNLGFLVLAEDQMYIYLPEFRRLRRIASHSKKESFVGSDFSYNDLGTGGFSSFYEAQLAGEDEEAWIIELERKPAADKPYKQMKMWVSKESELPVRMELYDNSGNLWKVSEEENKKVGNYWIAAKITMEDKKKNTYTVLEMKDIKVDQGLEDEIFTQRFLKRRVK